MNKLTIALVLLLAACGTTAQIFRDSPEQLQTEKTFDLCVAYGLAHTPPILSELQRRNAIRPEFLNAVQEHHIQLGMSSCEAVSAWYRPQSVNRTVTAHGESEQWVYSRGQYVYLDGGFVTGFQDSE